MSHLIRRLVLPLVLILFASAPLRAAEGVELRWAFKKGQTFKYLMKHHEVRTVAVGDGKFETTTDLDLDWQWTVADIDDKGVATVEAKLAGLKASIKGRDYEVQYDSAGKNTTEDAYAKTVVHYFDQLRFAKYRLRLGPDGRGAEFRGLDKVIADLPAGNQAADFHGLALRDDTFAWYLQQALGLLPEAKVTEGGKWKEPVKTKLAGLGEMTGQTEYRLDKPAKSGDVLCQVVRFEGSATVDLGMQFVNLSLSGPLKIIKVEGAVRFDPKAGAVHDSEYKTEMSGDLKLGDGGTMMKVGYKQTVTWQAK
jgi:hypothetical protein